MKLSMLLGRNAWLHPLIVAVGIVMLYPILWLIMSSFKPSELIFSDLSLWPARFTLDNYRTGWKGVSQTPFWTFMVNSALVCLLCLAGNLLSCSLAAYAFGRMEFTLKRFWFAVMLATIMLPHHVTIIPQYILFQSIGWVDSYLPLSVPKFLATEAFFVFLMVQFVRGLPRELDESATIDGCGRFAIYARIVMPLAFPALVTTAIFTFIWTWDDFFGQLLYLNTSRLYTVPLGLRMFMDSSGESAWGPLFAMSVLALVPSLVLFFSLQRYFVDGISTTGIKG